MKPDLQLGADVKTLPRPEHKAGGSDLAEINDGLTSTAAVARGGLLWMLAVICHGDRI
jgi:hypothetical protein